MTALDQLVAPGPGTELTVTVKDPRFLPAMPLCPCCGEGYPVCADVASDGTKYSHAQTCATYTFAETLCPSCIQFVALPDPGSWAHPSIRS